MYLSLSFFVAYLASTVARHVAAADPSELELHNHSPEILNRDESMSLSADPETWNQLLDMPQTPIQADIIEPSVHDPECIGIHTLVPVLNGATCTVQYPDPNADEQHTFRFSAQNLTAYFRQAVNCPHQDRCKCEAPPNDQGYPTGYYPRKYNNTEGFWPDEGKYCEFPIITVFGEPDKPWCGNKMSSGFLRLVYSYFEKPRGAAVVGLMYYSRDDRECPGRRAGCLKKCDFL